MIINYMLQNPVPKMACSESEQPAQRTIHYLGSKLRLLAPIQEALSLITPEGRPICDLFAGSGVVSLAMANRWNVTSVDIQEYSRVLCNGLANPPTDAADQSAYLCSRAKSSSLRKDLRHSLDRLLELEFASLDEASRNSAEGLCDLLENGSLISIESRDEIPPILRRTSSAAMTELKHRGLSSGAATTITRHFGGSYFSWEQAIDLDALLAEVHLLSGTDRDFHLSAIFATASDVVSTIGKHFAQPIKLRSSAGTPKRHLISKTLRDRKQRVFERYQAYCDIFGQSQPHRSSIRAVRSDYIEFLDSDVTPFAAVYADPPYTRDHYSRFYHVLETMALRDDPAVATTTIRTNGKPRLSRGLYRQERHQSPFCIPSKAYAAFQKLFHRVSIRRVPLLLSYSPYSITTGNRPRLLTIEDLMSLAKRYFRKIDITSLDGVHHNKFNLASRNIAVDYAAEALIICRP